MRVENLKKYFGEVRAVDYVSFELDVGQVYAVVGPNGAGKSTLINVLTNHIPADSGRIIFMGKDITGTSERERIKLGIVRSFQIPQLFENLPAIDNIRIAILSRIGRSGNPVLYYRKNNDLFRESAELLRAFNIPETLLVRDLSQGQRKLVDVAIAMAFRPKLLLLDEPTSGVSSEEKHDIIKKILEIQKSLGDTTILMVEHDFDIVRYADQVFVMNFGKIIAKGNYKEVILENENIKNILGM